MRYPLIAGAGSLLLVALACSDAPSALESVGVPDANLNHSGQATTIDWQTGRCPSQYALAISWAHDTDAAGAADANGNGAVCMDVNGDGPYSDDAFTCADGEEDVFVGDHPADTPNEEDGTGFDGVLCIDQTSQIAYDDCTVGNTSGSTGGGTIGDGGDDGGTGFPGLDPFSGSVGIQSLSTCLRPAEYDDVEDARCPAGFEPPFVADANDAVEASADANGNGLVCWNDGVYADDLVGLSLTAGRVNGHGVFTADGSTLSFSFHARSDGERVRGNFEFHDRTGGTTHHGTVTCLEADGATVHLEGVITNSKRRAHPEGTVIAWTATDNGEGKRAPADQVSVPETFGTFHDACAVRPSTTPLDIHAGNVQVKG